MQAAAEILAERWLDRRGLQQRGQVVNWLRCSVAGFRYGQIFSTGVLTGASPHISGWGGRISAVSFGSDQWNDMCFLWHW